MIEVGSLVTVIIYLFVIGGICGLLWWLIGFIPLPEPFAKVARVVIAVFAVLACINLLLIIGGMTPIVRIR
jgi:hypothetical protein